MDAQVALLHLWTVFVLTAELNWIDTAEVYTNAWAVQINGGPEEADRIAKEHGFINHGNVSWTSNILYLCVLALVLKLLLSCMIVLTTLHAAPIPSVLEFSLHQKCVAYFTSFSAHVLSLLDHAVI